MTKELPMVFTCLNAFELRAYFSPRSNKGSATIPSIYFYACVALLFAIARDLLIRLISAFTYELNIMLGLATC